MDGEAGWWTTSGNIGLPPLARAMGVGRQQQHGLGCVYVCESYVVLDQCDESPSLFVLSVCAYGGEYFWCFSFCVSFDSCIVMMSGWVLCTSFFSSSILFLMPFMLI